MSKLRCAYVVSVLHVALWRNRSLAFFLDGDLKTDWPGIRDSQCIRLGWGRKKSGLNAVRLAAECVLLEDGFLRSLGLASMGYEPCSLVLDNTGIYYDASSPSDLEIIIRDSGFALDDLQRAARCIELIKKNRLSKYNHASDITLFDSTTRSRILVIDQTWGDASIVYGGADSSTFETMLTTATLEHPEAEILVKIHPDVLAGKKKGHLLDAAKNKNCRIIAEDVSPWSLLDLVQHVYVVTSQFGFDALLANKKVTCFGMPFYAGWGLTDDRLSCARRGKARSLETVFYAAYIQYSKYINPYTLHTCELEDTVRLISHQKQHLEKHRGRWLLFGFSKWKTRFITDFLNIGANVLYTKNIKKDLYKLAPGDNLLVWGRCLDDESRSLCDQLNIKIWHMEDGFLRSVGLGVHLVRPLSLVVDSSGMYYDARTSSDLEVMLNTYQFDREILNRAKAVWDQLVTFRLSKYNVGHAEKLILPTDKAIILVPGQVEDDASVLLGSPEITSNSSLLVAVRENNPDAFVIYKPHPDVLSGVRSGGLTVSATELYDLQVEDIHIADLYDMVDEVHTMTSLAGFEALLRDKKVVTYGMPFYAGWGLTVDKLVCERRQRTLSLEALIAGALILYPTYVDPDSGQVCDIETIMELLVRGKDKVQTAPFKLRLYRTIQSFFNRLLS
ncbi:MAG: capsular polysaccharide biosynthesis protein [Paraglaciecola chathamensis]